MMTNKDWANVKWFEKKEWVQNPNKVSKTLVFEMDKLRERVGRPCIIHEAWADSGHAENSYHYTGQAVDFHFIQSTGINNFIKEFVLIMQSNLFNGIGFYPDWLPRPGWHVDIRYRKEKLLWTRTNAEYEYGMDIITNSILSSI